MVILIFLLSINSGNIKKMNKIKNLAEEFSLKLKINNEIVCYLIIMHEIFVMIKKNHYLSLNVILIKKSIK